MGMETVPDYRKLKIKYFSMLDKKGLEKGRMRTFIGLSSWIYRHHLQSSESDPIELHLESLSVALEDALSIKENSELRKKLGDLRGEWVSRPARRNKPTEKRMLSPPISEIKSWKHNGLNAVSLFSGAMGLDLGFLAAGFDIRVANDIDPWSRDTVKTNLPDLRFIDRNIDDVTTKELLDLASIAKGEVDILVGGPPCQPFSPAGKRMGLSDPRASPLKYFINAIRELQPKAFVMEEVPGLLSSRLKHFPISEREKREPTGEEEEGSAFKVVLQMLRSTNYNMVYGKLNSADFGSPQVRERLIFLGLRDSSPSLPERTHSGSGIAGTLPWNTFWEATADLKPPKKDFAGLSDVTKKYMSYIPPGGNWRELPEELTKDAMKGAYYAGGGKMGFYRRLSWDEPSPTVVTTPSQKGTMFVHPEQDRMISVREYGRVQGFPDDWEIVGSASDKYRLIGNAVSVHLSYAVALHVRSLLEGKNIVPTSGIYAYE